MPDRDQLADFVGAYHSGHADTATRSTEILRNGLGGADPHGERHDDRVILWSADSEPPESVG